MKSTKLTHDINTFVTITRLKKNLIATDQCSLEVIIYCVFTYAHINVVNKVN